MLLHVMFGYVELGQVRSV